MPEAVRRAYTRRPKPEPIDEQLPLVGSDVNGRVVVRGRNGERLTRTRSNTSDFYNVPEHIVPQGYKYQWNAVSVLNKPHTNEMIKMYAQGWRPVPAGRHPGLYMPDGTNEEAAIEVDGLRLEERPIELCEEAEAEGRAAAFQLQEDQKDELGLRRKLPSGMTRDNAELRRHERANTRRTIAPAPDVPRPRVELDRGQD
jgi:hypothetical protein